jgi:uncharacterized protein
MAVSASFGLAGCAAFDALKASISQWLDTVKFTGEGEVLPGNAPEAAPVIAPKRIPKKVAKAPKKKIKAAARKLQRPQTVVLPPKKPLISDSPEAARPDETEGRSAPPTSMRLRTPYPEAPPASAQFNLGFMHSKGQGVQQNDAEALKWYRLAADQGHARAQFILGRMYRVQRNDAEAVKWLRLAADQGVAEAQGLLGGMYHLGQGVQQNDAEAVKWFRLATDQGYAMAQYFLGRMYATGRGVPQDYVRAQMWFNLSAAQGDQDAARERDNISKRMSPAQIAEAQKLAREWRPAP